MNSLFDLSSCISGRSFGQLVPLKDMDVGDSFIFPNVDSKRVESRIEQYGKTNGATFMVNIGDECTCWRVS